MFPYIDAEEAYAKITEREDQLWLAVDDLVRAKYGIGAMHLHQHGAIMQTTEVFDGCRKALNDARICSLWGMATGLHLARQFLVLGEAENTSAEKLGVTTH